jgi:hypothetical protein
VRHRAPAPNFRSCRSCACRAGALQQSRPGRTHRVEGRSTASATACASRKSFL